MMSPMEMAEHVISSIVDSMETDLLNRSNGEQTKQSVYALEYRVVNKSEDEDSENSGITGQAKLVTITAVENTQDSEDIVHHTALGSDEASERIAPPQKFTCVTRAVKDSPHLTNPGLKKQLKFSSDALDQSDSATSQTEEAENSKYKRSEDIGYLRVRGISSAGSTDSELLNEQRKSLVSAGPFLSSGDEHMLTLDSPSIDGLLQGLITLSQRLSIDSMLLRNTSVYANLSIEDLVSKMEMSIFNIVDSLQNANYIF